MTHETKLLWLDSCSIVRKLQILVLNFVLSLWIIFLFLLELNHNSR